jgi:hypothetical protein
MKRPRSAKLGPGSPFAMAKPVLLLVAAVCLLPDVPAVGGTALPPWGALVSGVAVTLLAGSVVGLGAAICGGSAIAAATPAIGADDDDTSAALGAVFLLNATALHIPAKSIPWVRITPPNATRRSPEIQRTATGWAETSRTRWRSACEP